jgi:polyphosphate:AMP phosphotransferase
MFEVAELGQKVSKEEYQERVPALRQGLLEAQVRIREVGLPVILLFAGVDGAGKGDSANLLQTWMDPRFIITRAFSKPSQEEKERPEFWRYWRTLPPSGHMGIYLSAWYSEPLLSRVYGDIQDTELDDRLERILAFERTLANNGALIVKFWMHLGKKAQRKRLKSLEDDPLQSWRVTKQDWKHADMFGKFVATAEHILMRTSIGRAPWIIVEGANERYRQLKVGSELLKAIQSRVTKEVANGDPDDEPVAPEEESSSTTILSTLDLGKKLEKSDYKRKLRECQSRLNLLHRKARDEDVSTILVFEGWDAGGKGGAIRRLTPAIDARDYEVIQIAAPTDEEKAQHYLWRFWRHLSRAGRVTIFDRSWYGRVLVERVEGFASEEEWRRAYAEINDFEHQLIEHATGRSGISTRRP